MKYFIQLQRAIRAFATAIQQDAGQDLIEYALVVALIAFAAIVGMSTVASDINVAFSQIGTTLTSAVA